MVMSVTAGVTDYESQGSRNANLCLSKWQEDQSDEVQDF